MISSTVPSSPTVGVHIAVLITTLTHKSDYCVSHVSEAWLQVQLLSSVGNPRDECVKFCFSNFTFYASGLKPETNASKLLFCSLHQTGLLPSNSGLRA